MHWSMLARGLGAPSHLLRDSSGNRIYATFTRFRFESTRPLFEYAENERLELEAIMSRYGAGIYFSTVRAQGHLKGIDARLMSTFSRLEKPGSNTSLLKGLPEIPKGCPIPATPELPELAANYRARRTQALPPATFECDYEIMPSHDINGVGLLYFAAYPIINDICATRYAGRSFATDFSTVYRDIFYFGNSDADDSLIFQLHHWAADEACIDLQASIRRKSDNYVIAHILTRKLRCERGVEARETASVAGA